MTKISALFTTYTQAFDEFDAHAIAGLYRLPCAISDGDGVQTYNDRAELVEKFAKNCEQMTQLGYQSADFNILQQTALGDGAMAMDLCWQIHTINGPIEFRTLYICHCTDDGWRIFNANVYPGSFER